MKASDALIVPPAIQRARARAGVDPIIAEIRLKLQRCRLQGEPEPTEVRIGSVTLDCLDDRVRPLGIMALRHLPMHILDVLVQRVSDRELPPGFIAWPDSERPGEWRAVDTGWRP